MDPSFFEINENSISIKDKGRKGHVIIDDSIEGILSIASYGFAYSQLESIDLSKSKIEKINSHGFAYMNFLQEIILPLTLKTIIEHGFRATSLPKIVLPPSVTSIGGAAFENCKFLNDISLSSPSEHYRIEDGCLISISEEKLVRARANIDIFYLNVSSIGASAFAGTSIRKFISSKSLKTFEAWALSSSERLVSIDLTNSSLEYIPNNSFQRCQSLLSIVIPPSVRSIGNNAFLWCSDIQTVIYLGSSDFQDVKAFDSPSSVKVYVLSSYDYDRFCQSSVHRISYLDLHHFIVFGQITCNYRNANYNYLIFFVFICM